MNLNVCIDENKCNIPSPQRTVSDSVDVKADNSVDFPTLGKPISATRASPKRATSKPYVVYQEQKTSTISGRYGMKLTVQPQSSVMYLLLLRRHHFLHSVPPVNHYVALPVWLLMYRDDSWLLYSFESLPFRPQSLY